MSGLGDIFRRVGAYLMQVSEPVTPIEPQVGMLWQMVQHRRDKHPDTHARKETLATYQIATLDEKSVGIVENYCYYRLYKREKWDELYAANFAKSRSANGMVGRGRLVPEYAGIREPVSVAHKLPNVLPFIYIDEPSQSILHVERDPDTARPFNY